MADHEPNQSVQQTPTMSRWGLSSLLAGPIAGVCSRFFIYPFDTIKARLQVQGGLAQPSIAAYQGVWHAIRTMQIAGKEGLRGFYRGFPAVVIGNIPANAAYFSGYELGKTIVPGGWGPGGDMITGACAQLTGGLLFTPIDIFKERMQVQGMLSQQNRYANSWQAVKHLVHQQGIGGIFKGYWATNAVWIPWSMIHISVYEQLKLHAAEWNKDNAKEPTFGSSSTPSSQEGTTSQSDNAVLNRQDEGAPPPPAWLLGCCSAVSASIASVLTHPMDVIKTRLQVYSGDAKVTAKQLALEAWRTEGPRVFMAGAFARVLTLAPGSALSWMVYEPVKNFLDQMAT